MGADLQREDVALTAEVAADANLAEFGARATPKVLLVDDRQENLFALERLLAGLEAELLKATSGSDALGLMLRHHFAVVLLDVQMPGMDGFETARLMREHAGTRDTPVIFVTALSKEQRYVRAGYESGAVDYLLKPIDPDILVSKVRVFLDLETQRTGLQQALGTIKRINHRQKLILNCADEGILGLDAEGHITFSNPAAERLLITSGRELCGIAITEIFSDETGRDGNVETIKETVRREGQFRSEDARFQCFDGSTMPVDFSFAAVVDDEHGYAGGVLVFNDITHRKNVEQQLMRLARYDELTGLANRTLFREFLRKSMARARRGGRLMSLLFLDLDRFKSVNDELGHSAGDTLLRSVGARLTRAVREGDLVARLGGDEFAVVLDEIDAPESVGSIAEKILSELSRPHIVNGRRVTTHSSIGIAVYSGDREPADALIRKADTAMYEAKRCGRNGYRYYADNMSSDAAARSTMESELSEAIEGGALSVHFQPQFAAGTGELRGFEALARWYDDHRGFVSPAEFIPAAEESGLIEPLGVWILNAACAQLEAWIAAGLVPGSMRISVNVSVLQLHSGRLVSIITEALNAHALTPQNLEIELTESTVMDDAVGAIEQLAELHALGVRVAVDDFGTGYSSLSYLQRLPIDTLKVDRTFVHGLGTGQGNEAIVESIVALATSLKLDVVAEGVETEDQLKFLKACGCGLVQGFLLARPGDASAIEGSLRSGEFVIGTQPGPAR